MSRKLSLFDLATGKDVDVGHKGRLGVPLAHQDLDSAAGLAQKHEARSVFGYNGRAFQRCVHRWLRI